MRTLDEDQYGIVASLNLSSSFDVININLLITRLKIIGLPEDIVTMTKDWLQNRSFYISVDGANLVQYDLLLGTVQGSTLGPVLYSIYILPLFDPEFLLTFVDDNYILRFNSSWNY
jgi:hypothetical protein